MSFLPGPELWGRLLGILLIDLVLAGDNAVVIALAVRGLPANVKTLGTVWGTVGAIVLRIACTFAATAVLRLPGAQILGGALLLGIAFRLVQPHRAREHPREAAGLVEAIWLIAVADTAMSLDNVLAIAAIAAGNTSLMVVGVALSLPLVMWGSWVLADVMNRHAWVVWAGSGVLGYVAGEMAVRDAMTKAWLGPGGAGAAAHVLPAVVGVGIALIGWRRSVRSGRSHDL
ncbi:MAG TPA: TerC family protein [bacterium]